MHSERPLQHVMEEQLDAIVALRELEVMLRPEIADAFGAICRLAEQELLYRDLFERRPDDEPVEENTDE